MEQIRNFIDGGFHDASSGGRLVSVDPATGADYAELPASDAEDVARAVAAASRAFPAWAAMPSAERGRILEALAAAIESRLDEFAAAESRDTGKPLSLARTVDIPRAVSNFEFYADAGTQFASESHAMPGAINYTLREPLGVVGCISPWNLPLYLFTWKIAPALAAGNTVVAKPSEVTPMTAYLLSTICDQAGLPPGVLNVIHGAGATAGQALVEHPEVKAISFTGGTLTGERIAKVAAPMLKKLSLELGGKNPTLVFDDCDIEHTLDQTVRAAFSNQGQVCMCGSRILVQRSIYDRFRDGLVQRIAELSPSDPSLEETRVGAVVSEAHMQKILAAIEQARNDGGTILTGGGRATLDGRCADGWFVQPTLIEGLGPDCAANQEEIFGPVATLLPFDHEDEALALANGVRYGLAASVWTRDVSRAHRLGAALQAGLVWVNCWMLRDLRVPIGGMKDSGVGREGGFEAMRFFTQAKNVCVEYG